MTYHVLTTRLDRPRADHLREKKNCLDKIKVLWNAVDVLEIEAIEDPRAAEVSLDETRALLLSALAEPGSAATLARATGQPRQKVNYHMRTLEAHGLIELVEERRKGNMTERVMQASAASYVISPAALSALQPDPGRAPDRLSARWLLALAGRLVADVGSLLASATRARQRLATFAMDGEVRFASASDRAAFAEELLTAVSDLIGKYHDADAPQGRTHRLVVAVHPAIDRPTQSTTADENER